jgi:hypothetical protein
MKTFNIGGLGVRTIFQNVSSGRGIESNVNEAVDKSSVKFEIDIHPDKRPEIFTHSFISDPDNFIYLKFS